MIYLGNAGLRRSEAAEEKQPEPLISHSIGFNKDLILILISSCFCRRGDERLGFRETLILFQIRV